MDVSPIDLQKALRGAQYPAGKQDLTDLARQNEASGDVARALDALPEREYDGPDEVNAALGGG